MPPKPLAATDARFELFCREYLVDFNATMAAQRAGLAKAYGSCKSRGSEMMQRDDVSQRIAELVAERKARIEVTEDALVEELRRIAFAGARSVMTWGAGGMTPRESVDLTEEEAASVAEVSETKTEHGGTIKVKQHDKLGALRLLMQYKGMLRDKVEHTGAGGAPLVFELVGMDTPPAAAPKRARATARPVEDVEEV